MKIAHLVSTFPPYKGGIGNVCYYQAIELAKTNHEVTVFTPNYRRGKDLSVREFPFKIVRLLPVLKYGNAAFIPQLIFKLKKFDIIHIHYPFIGIEFLYLIKLFNKDIKIVLQYQMDLVGKGWLKLLFFIHRIFILPVVIIFSDKVIVSSWDYFKNSFIYKYHKKYPNKFIELFNGVDLSLFRIQPKDAIIKKTLKIDDKKKILLFVGGLDKAHYFKGLNVLIRAIKSIEDIQLLIVGSGNLEGYYKKLSKDIGVSDKTFFVGKVSDEDLVKYYNLCDIFALPSIDKTEAFGLVLLEALACGKAIIASNLPGVRKIVSFFKNGKLFKIGSISDLSIKIIELLNDPGAMQESVMQENRDILKKYYSWNVLGHSLKKIYYSVI